MAERDYFALRYNVPGFVFILVVFGTNYSVVLNIIGRQGATDVLSVSIAILSLFASSAIGFLLSQIWFTRFHRKRIYADILRSTDYDIEKSMKDSFGWIPKPKDENDEKRDEIMGTCIDYILNSHKAKENNLFKFFQRKIDLYHTMSSTLWSFLIGIGFGGLTRIIWYLRIERNPFDSFFDVSLFLATVTIAIFFIVILRFLKRKIFFEYHPMLELVLNEEINEKIIKNLNRTFPDYIKSEE